MEEIRKYTKILTLSVTFLKKEELSTKLNNLKLKKIHKIPSCIDPLKKYSTFEIIENVKERIIVLLDEDCDQKINIKLKYEYFSHEEIFNVFLKCQIPKSFQTVGHIIHINLNEEQYKERQIIGDILLDKIVLCKTVVTKKGKIDNIFRNADLEVIAGEQNLETIHKEADINFFIDYGKVYWNSKLQNERKILFENFGNDEIICDPFCGVGPVALIGLKKGYKVICNDLNPFAIYCMKKTIKMNKLDNSKIEISNIDAEQFLTKLSKTIKITRFIFNLPELSLHFVKFLNGFDKDAWLHCYFFCKNEEENVCEFVNSIIKITNFTISECRNVSPKKQMYKLECKIGSIIFE